MKLPFDKDLEPEVSGRYRRKAMGIILMAAVLLLGQGCGKKSGPQRLRVYGVVERKSEPLVNGTISFLPAKGHTGPAANGSIVNGKFDILASEGPTAGPHEVQINLTHSKMNPEFAAGQSRQKSSRTRWDFKEEVSPEHADFDFILQEE